MHLLFQDIKPFKCSSPSSLPGVAAGGVATSSLGLPGGKVSPHPSSLSNPGSRSGFAHAMAAGSNQGAGGPLTPTHHSLSSYKTRL